MITVNISNKGCISVFLLLVMLLVMLPVRAEAAQIVETEIEYLPDGGYIETVVTESVSRASGTKTGTKVKRQVDADGNEQWAIQLQGTFSYNGTSASCTNAVCNVTVSANNLYVVSKAASKSGAVATANVTMGQKVLGITIAKNAYELTLTCDKNGNLS